MRQARRRAAELEGEAGDAGQLARARRLEKVAMPRWRVDYVGREGQHLGTVEAPDKKTAITEAMKTFHITPARRFKIVVARIDDNRKR